MNMKKSAECETNLFVFVTRHAWKRISKIIQFRRTVENIVQLLKIANEIDLESFKTLKCVKYSPQNIISALSISRSFLFLPADLILSISGVPCIKTLHNTQSKQFRVRMYGLAEAHPVWNKTKARERTCESDTFRSWARVTPGHLLMFLHRISLKNIKISSFSSPWNRNRKEHVHRQSLTMRRFRRCDDGSHDQNAFRTAYTCRSVARFIIWNIDLRWVERLTAKLLEPKF